MFYMSFNSLYWALSKEPSLVQQLQVAPKLLGVASEGTNVTKIGQAVEG